MSDARLVIWNPRNGQEIGSVELRVKPVVSDDDRILLSLDPVGGSPFIPERWAGMDFTIEVSPKAVTAEGLTSEIVDLAKRMGAPVG